VPHLMDRWFRAPYTNYTEAVLPKPGDVLNEWEVFWEISRRLGTPLAFPGGPAPTDHRPTDDEILDLAYAGSRMPMDEIRRHRMEIHPDRAILVSAADPECTARFTLAPDDIAHELAEVRHETDGAAAVSEQWTEFPFRLVSRRLKHVLNSLGTELPGLAAKGTTNNAYMNPDDMRELGVSEGGLIEITSPRASLHAVVAEAPDVRRGVVSMAHSWGGSSLTDEKVRDIGSPTNRLVSVDQGYDRVSGRVVQSAIPVRIAVLEASHPSHVH
ncbi:MAG: hypothetical protein RL547_1779, partial [Actinomycetota bacterium]